MAGTTIPKVLYIIIFLVLCKSLAVSSQLVIDERYECTFSDPITLDSDGQVTMQYFMNVREDTFSMRITYVGGHSWVGLGINTDQTEEMSPSFAVIGHVEQDKELELDENESYVGPAYRYYMNSAAEDGSGVVRLKDIRGHLKGSSFVQNPIIEEVGVSTLEFTHDMLIRNEDNPDIGYSIVVDLPPTLGNNNGGDEGSPNEDRTDDRLEMHEGDGETINDDAVVDDEEDAIYNPRLTRFIWAVGLPGNQWEGPHTVHGSFTLNMGLNVCTNLQSEAPSESPTTVAQAIAGNVSVGNIDNIYNDDDYINANQQDEALNLQDPVKHLWVSQIEAFACLKIYEVFSLTAPPSSYCSCITEFSWDSLGASLPPWPFASHFSANLNSCELVTGGVVFILFQALLQPFCLR
jgi:hypothetical protein